MIECSGKGGRKMLSALAKDTRYSCSPEDLAALRTLVKLTGGELAGMIQGTRAQAEVVLGAFLGSPRVTLGRNLHIPIRPFAGRLALNVAQDPGGALRLALALPSGLRSLPGATTAWLWDGKTVWQAAAGLPSAYMELFRSPSVEIPAAGAAAFIHKELTSLRQWFDVPEMDAPAIETTLTPVAEAPRFILKIEGSLNYLGAELQSQTERRQITITSPGYRPAHPAEQVALARLRQAGFEGPTPRGEWAMRGEQAILTFFARELPAFQRDWEVAVGARFEHVTKDLERVKPRFEVQSSGQNWFEVGFDLATEGGERLSAQEIRRLLASGRRTVRLSNQKTAVLDAGLLDDFEEILKDANPQQARPGAYRFDARDAAFLRDFAEQKSGAVVSRDSTQDWASELPFSRPVAPPVLGPEWSLLRSYQSDGVTWLNHLSKNGLGGVLADEMGLGKTVQTLAFLSTIPGPKLVVCPASLTVNWQREAERFAPALRPCILGDQDRAEIAGHLREDRLLITSYGLMRRDLEMIRAEPLAAVVLDEAQQIKNPESQTAQAAHRLRAGARLALTGTPVENGVRDIWSVMQFLMPGFLGSRETFRERFELPIRDHPGGAQHQRLTKRLRPFILRRTKAQVAKEIPAKIEQVIDVELTQHQRKLYNELLSATRQMIHENNGKKTEGPGKMAILTALLRLRQVCCDPRLLHEDNPEAEVHSCKLELLGELLEDAIEDGHRVLVFSQFARMLGLISRQLKSQSIDFCYLDGSTKDRQGEVDRFQKGAAPVFLISLKAGGFGLNLTAADTVIHYDPWWNPAVEAQASDRVHRIGQTRSVNIYKLVAKDTVEEKILALQGTKRELASQFIEGEQPLMEGLSFGEIEGLID
jgi:superfamily II DNA or RNA helicase